MCRRGGRKNRFCEGLRVPAHYGRSQLPRGRRPEASREGTRGEIRRCECRALYGDLIVADGAVEGGRSGRARRSRVWAGLNGALWRSLTQSDEDEQSMVVPRGVDCDEGRRSRPRTSELTRRDARQVMHVSS